MSKAATILYKLQQSTEAATNNALNEMVPKVYHKNPNGMSEKEYRPTNNPRAIIQDLTSRADQ
jgi:hypothetical protein